MELDPVKLHALVAQLADTQTLLTADLDGFLAETRAALRSALPATDG